MEIPQPSYAQTTDGTHIAYSVLGDGPIDLVYAFGFSRISMLTVRWLSTRTSDDASPRSQD